MSDKILSIISNGVLGSVIGIWSVFVVSKILRLNLYFEIKTDSKVNRYDCPVSVLLLYGAIGGGSTGVFFPLAKEYGSYIFDKKFIDFQAVINTIQS
jgi:hypothetical protein